MADKPIVNTFSTNSAVSVSKLNENFELLSSAVENCLGRGGITESPNSMQGNLDMNLYNLLNISKLGVDNLDISDTISANVVNTEGLIVSGVYVNPFLATEEGVGVSEIKTLSSGQTSISFVNDITTGIIYIAGKDVDGTRLLSGEDYTSDLESNTVNLFNSYPAGTKIVLTAIEGLSHISGADAVSYVDTTNRLNGVDNVQDAIDNTISEVITTDERIKLGGIEEGATADQTKIEIDALGIDADQLDGNEGVYYLDFNNTTNKPSPTIALDGDVTGSTTLTELANGTITCTVVDDSHNHTIANVDGLQTELDSKEDASNKGIANGYAGLDSNAKVYLDQLPDVSKQRTYVLLSTDPRPATPYEGDRLFETDTGDSYIYDGLAWVIMADADWENVNLQWSNITNVPSPTISLSGDATGSATLTELGNADITVTVADDSHNHIIDNVDGLQTALDGKADEVHNHTFDSLTSKDQGTGNYETTGRFVSGKDSGETAVEDGAVAFNHTDNIPDQNGNSGRISVNVDAAGTATLTVGLGSNVTAGTVASLIEALTLTASGMSVNGDITSQTGVLNGTASDSNLLEGQSSSWHIDWNNTTNKPSPTLTLTGDASGQATFTEVGDATLDVTMSGGGGGEILETHQLTSGQTTVIVNTAGVATEATPITTSSPDVGGRLLVFGVDYTLPDTSTIELTESYPAGTYLLIGA